MANKIDISNDVNKKNLNDILRKSFQSANINFLIGSGCSVPAITPLGDIEKNIQQLFEEKKELDAENLMYQFLVPIAESNEKLIGNSDDIDITDTLNTYTAFLGSVFHILTKSKNNILPKKANIFSTNYDLFVEKASEKLGVEFNLNDGFNRNPRLDSQFRFSEIHFFNTIFNIGHLYNYKVEVPSINLIKLHGSFSWAKLEQEIICRIQNYLETLKGTIQEIQEAKKNHDYTKLLSLLKDFNQHFNIILPIHNKLRHTLLDRIYYGLLRIYANELDKENTLLIAEGFSFEDEHILDITQRALKNPTLLVIIFCLDEANIDGYEDKFRQYNNLHIVYNNKQRLDFAGFNKIFEELLQEDQPQEKSGVASQEEQKQ